MCFKLNIIFVSGLCLLLRIANAVSSSPVRLATPLNNGVGRVEIFHNGEWGTVCDNGFTDLAARVVCRQLRRYQSGFQPKAIHGFGFGSGKIWMDNVRCTGAERSLASCSHSNWGTHDCEHKEDVGVICDASNVNMKLTPGYKSGLLQVFHSNAWGTVCDDNFGRVEATVVCRALGYESGSVTDESSSIRMWLDDVDCSMNNTDLKDCKHSEWGQHDCGNNEAVGVDCYSFPEGEINCTFDTDACGWTKDQNDTLDWTRTSTRTYSYGAGPLNDHTTGHGYYMNIRSPSYTRGQSARLISPNITVTGQMCLAFYYYIYGNSTNTLNVYISRSGSLGSPVWTKGQIQDYMWKRVQIAGGSTVTAVTNIVFEGVPGTVTSYHGDIAIDDVSLTCGSCYPGEFNCTFDGGVCGWAPDWTGDFAWTRYSGGTPSDQTGSYSDHTSGHGYYMYIETSSFQHGQKARLISPSVNSAVPMCLDFYYHMCGLHGNALNIYIYRNGSLGNIIWTGSMTQGNVWKRARILIDGGSTNKGVTNIVFEGVTGGDHRGDIAIDDVSLAAGSCDHGEFNCTFDGGVCGWAPDWTGDFAWTRYSGGTPSDQTGSYSDHTSGHGYYMYIETSSFQHGQKARLISPSVNSAVPMCLDFYYHMCGLHGNALNIYVYRNGSLGNVIWTGSRTQGNVWKRARILIDGGSTNKIVFEGVTGGDHRGDIAIDDVSLAAGSCDHVPAFTRTYTVADVLGIFAVVIGAVLIVLVVYLSWKLRSASARDLLRRNSEEIPKVSNPLHGQIDGNTETERVNMAVWNPSRRILVPVHDSTHELSGQACIVTPRTDA